MGLLGSYSNPDIQKRLRRLSEELDRLAASPGQPRPSQRPDRKLRNGLVPNAIKQVLAEAMEPMQVKDIHAAIESQLGMSVPKSSINVWLSQNAKDERPPVVRLGHGRYRLVSAGA